MHKEIGDPFRIFYICFSSWDSFHMAGIYHHGFQVRGFRDMFYLCYGGAKYARRESFV